MKKSVRVKVFVLVGILIACASIVFAQGGWDYRPPINHTGEIGDATHIWGKGFFDYTYLGSAGTSYIRTTTTTITSAQLLALYDTAIAVVAAPGTHFITEILGCDLYYKHTTTAYSVGSGTNLQLKYVNKSGTAASGTQAITGLIDSNSADYTAKLIPAAVAAGAASLRENQVVVMSLAGGNPSTGTGTLTVKVTYMVHPTGF